MEYIINGRKPIGLFRYFEEISAIPRGSYNEKAIAEYIESFAKARGLYCVRDKVDNVFVRKPASLGRESEKSVLLQAHTDMVCEQNEGTGHDFMKDPLKLYLDGNLLRAKGTTLGADDGIGVALMLWLLDDKTLSLPCIECLFTVSEETGMDGVNNFDFSEVKARRMINLDSENIGTVVSGCAGGVRCNVIIDGTRKESKGKAIRLTIGGLAGGHSGENIADGKANANKLMGRLLLELKKTGYELSELNGGGKSNAIPRECHAVIVTDEPQKICTAAKSFANELKAELSADDAGFFLKCEELDAKADVFDEKTADSITALLGIAANGVLEMSKYIKGFVEYSRNLGVITTEESGVTFTFFARSAIDSQLNATKNELIALAALCGGKIVLNEEYHGWNYAPNSELRKKYLEAGKAILGREPVVRAIHAGLECGIISAAIPDMDIISVGPNTADIHSPNESLDLDSVEAWASIIEKVLSK